MATILERVLDGLIGEMSTKKADRRVDTTENVQPLTLDETIALLKDMFPAEEVLASVERLAKSRAVELRAGTDRDGDRPFVQIVPLSETSQSAGDSDDAEAYIGGSIMGGLSKQF